MKHLLMITTLLLSFTTMAGEIPTPRGYVSVKRLSADGWYEQGYGISANKAFENEDGSVTLTIPFYTIGGRARAFRGSVPGGKICKALGLGRKLDKDVDHAILRVGSGSPWAISAEGRELMCINCKVSYVSELTCEGK